MSDQTRDPLSAFVERVAQQLTKHGFPERAVSFPIEKMYESAAAKGLSFNKVLELLGERGIAHEKTPEKIIFSPTTAAPPQPAPSAFAGLDPSMFGGLDPSMFAGMSQEQLLSAAQSAMQQMGPDQMAALRAMVEGMTPEQQAEMLEQAKKLGLA
jgi:hypothetical protein